MNASQAQKAPAVGDGATICMYSDRHACTIIAVNGKTVTVQRDIATRSDSNGMSDSQSYDYSPDPNGVTEEFSLRANGAYVKVGDAAKNGTRLAIGNRREFHDFSF